MLVVDFDGTLFDFEESLRRASVEVLGRPLAPEDVRKLEKELKAKIYDLNIRKYAKFYKINIEVLNFLRKMEKEGYKVVILTGRPCEVKDIIENLVKKYEIRADIVCRGDLGISDEEFKLEFIKSLDAEEVVVMEDKIDNIEYLKEGLPDIKAFLVRDGRVIAKDL